MFGRYAGMLIGAIGADACAKQGVPLLWLIAFFTAVWLMCEAADRMTRRER